MVHFAFSIFYGVYPFFLLAIVQQTLQAENPKKLHLASEGHSSQYYSEKKHARNLRLTYGREI